MNKTIINKRLWAAMYVDGVLSDQDSVLMEFAMDEDSELEALVRECEAQREAQFNELEDARELLLHEMTAADENEPSVFERKKGIMKAGRGIVARLRESIPQYYMGTRLALAAVLVFVGIGSIWYFINKNSVNEIALVIPYYEENFEGGTGFGPKEGVSNVPVSDLTLNIYISEAYSDTTYTYQDKLIKLYVPASFRLDLSAGPSLKYDYKKEVFLFGIGKKYSEVELDKPRQRLPALR